MTAFQTNIRQLVLRKLLRLRDDPKDCKVSAACAKPFLISSHTGLSAKLLYWAVPYSMSSMEFIIFPPPHPGLPTFHVPFQLPIQSLGSHSDTSFSSYVQNKRQAVSGAMPPPQLSNGLFLHPHWLLLLQKPLHISLGLMFSPLNWFPSLCIHPLSLSPTLLPAQAFQYLPKKGI